MCSSSQDKRRYLIPRTSDEYFSISGSFYFIAKSEARYRPQMTSIDLKGLSWLKRILNAIKRETPRSIPLDQSFWQYECFRQSKHIHLGYAMLMLSQGVVWVDPGFWFFLLWFAVPITHIDQSSGINERKALRVPGQAVPPQQENSMNRDLPSGRGTWMRRKWMEN